jgi:spore maturation protein CgeB
MRMPLADYCAAQGWETPAEYAWLYRGILADPKAAEQRALLALEEVYARHTTFHRAEKLAAELAALS